MAFNLIRNARMFFTTNVSATTGVVATTGFTASNTFEIQVLDGLSFSQNTGSETVTLNEAGATPARGQRSFNTSLDPVEFSFSTYIRPRFQEGALADPDNTDDYVGAEEEVLWNALAGTGAIGGAGAGWTRTVGVSPVSTLAFTNSNAHQLQKFGVIIILDGSSYVIDNCALDSATIDFGLDAIATIAWTGRGTVLRSATITANTSSPVGLSGSYFTAGTNVAKAKDTGAPYIANKLSTLVIKGGISGTGTTYTIPLTGGSISIANNLTYLTPANLGVVNQATTYFTGTRAVTGTINAYLRTGGSDDAGALLAAMLAGSASDVDPEFQVDLAIGGSANSVRVQLLMPACVLTIPTVNTEQVVSTAINFTAQGYSGSAFDIGSANELQVKYYSNV